MKRLLLNINFEFLKSSAGNFEVLTVLKIVAVLARTNNYTIESQYDGKACNKEQLTALV